MSDTFYQPTPSEIAEACAEIRSGWTTDDHIARREKIPPMISDCDFGAVAARAQAENERRLTVQRGAG